MERTLDVLSILATIDRGHITTLDFWFVTRIQFGTLSCSFDLVLHLIVVCIYAMFDIMQSMTAPCTLNTRPCCHRCSRVRARLVFFNKWRLYRGKHLHRLVCYMWSTLDYMQEGCLAQRDATSLQMVAYSDADVRRLSCYTTIHNWMTPLRRRTIFALPYTRFVHTAGLDNIFYARIRYCRCIYSNT